ncbi:MAG: DUF2254 domain-containing protein [Propionibacteriaceae bacterium]|nr:DUF2254 domain-containing protein [Propionibacteriaceae bacterium]
MYKLWRRLERLTGSFWFVPVVCVGASILVAEGLVALDRSIDHARWPILAPLQRMGLEGARGLLGGIGGTTFGAAATAFSITISVIATASTSYGPRLVGNFMSNRRNQWTLGVLVSTFVYTTLVVRTLRSTDDGAVFVPHLAVHFAIGLAIADVFLLISFIHHIATSIQVDTLTSVVSGAFQRTAKRSDELVCDEHTTTLQPPSGGEVVRSGADGYIVSIVPRLLLGAAEADGGRIAIEARVGDRVLTGTPLARIWPGQDADHLAQATLSAIEIGPRHDPGTDAGYAQQQLVELAVRALSPGVNDPYTAVNVIEELALGLAQLVSAPLPAPVLVDDEGQPRVFLRPVTVKELIDMPFRQILPFSAGQHLVHTALVDLARHIEQHNVHPSLRGVAWRHVETIRAQCNDHSAMPGEDEALDAHIRAAERLLELSRQQPDT